jgi:cytochrome b561
MKQTRAIIRCSALHWLLALLIIAVLFAGFFLLAATPNFDPQKIRVLLVHMTAGMTILELLVVAASSSALFTSRSAPATTGHAIALVLAGFTVLHVLAALYR